MYSLFPDIEKELWRLSIDEFKYRIRAVSNHTITCIYARLPVYMRAYLHICTQMKSGLSGARATDAN